MDVLYPVKPIPSREMLYSVRSLAKNYKHDTLFVCGGYPQWLKDFVYIHNDQKGNKWQNAGGNIRKACEWDMLSDDFVLFNDDFYILKPVDEPKNYYSGSLKDKIERHPENRYRFRLQKTYDYLMSIGIEEPRNYELHLPMVYNKHNMREITHTFPDIADYATRSLYGNLYVTDAEELEDDVKLWEQEHTVPEDWTYLSISDKYYQSRNFDQIRYKFSEKCRYEW